LFTQPCEINLQIPVTVQQMAGMLQHHDVDRLEQPLQIALLHKGGAEIWHDEVAHKQHSVIGQMDEQRIVSFSPLHGDEFEARAADLHLCVAVDRDIGLEALDILQPEPAAEEA
jgi:hypothetical protein